ncbi:MAG: hypothetical protein AB8G15_06900 [Saprospiraceae bacterium]
MRNVLCFFLLLQSTLVFSQSFVTVKAAYAFGRNESINIIKADAGKISSEKFSLGAGIHPEVSWMFCLSENFAFTLDASFLIGTDINATGGIYRVENLPAPYFVNNIGSPPSSILPLITAFALESQRLYLTPNLLISTGGDGFQFYSKIGFTLPVYQRTDLTYAYRDEVLAKDVEASISLKNDFSVGLKTAIGANIEVSKLLSFFIEMDYLALQVATETATFTSYKIDGVASLDNLGTAKTIDYSTEISSTTNGNEKQTALTLPVAYDQLGFGLGVRFRLTQ